MTRFMEIQFFAGLRMNIRRVALHQFCILVIALATFLDAASPCKNCHNNNNNNLIDPKTMAHYRIEAIKQKILDKLRMSKAPVSFKPRRPVPKGIFGELNTRYSDEPSIPEDDSYSMEDFYATENQIVVFAEAGSTRCSGSKTIACLSFTLPATLHKKGVDEAKLHVYMKNTHPRLPLTIKDRSNGDPTSITREDFVGDNINTEHIKEGWFPIEQSGTVRKWSYGKTNNAQSSQTFVLQISCEGCSSDQLRSFPMDGDLMPFLVINPDMKRSHRIRRGIDCSPGHNNCCRETLFVNFTEIGWDSWILEPKGYYANYCKGQCSNGIHMPTYQHSAVMQSTIRPEVNTCCSPTRMSGVALLFYDGEGSVHRSVLPNMSVDSCGCS